MQVGILDWFAQNLVITITILVIIQVLIIAIYIKLYVRIFYEGTTYKHYRKGRLLRESNKGGMVFLIPLFDRLEFGPPSEPSIEDIADSLGKSE